MTVSTDADSGAGGTDVLTFGEAMVALRAAGPVATGTDFSMHLAGAESNVAVALARLGHRVSWVGRLGADEFGGYVRRELRAEGVDVSAVGTDPHRPTGLMLLERRTADLTRVRYHRAGSAGSALSTTDLAGPLAAGARWLHVTGITPALSPGARDAWLHAVHTARAAGIPVCLDVNHRARLWSRDNARAVLAGVAGAVTVVVASADELDLVTAAGTTEADGAAELLGRGVRTVLVKLGAAGARAYTTGGVRHVPALRVSVVDTIGAGDAFTAGWLSGQLDGLDTDASLHRAVTLGAFAVSARGDWEGLPYRHELSLLDEHGAGDAIR